MEVAALIKSIADPEAPQEAFGFTKAPFDPSGVPSVLGPFESNALELALQVAELAGGSVMAVAMGGKEQEKGLRRALAAGAQRAVRIDAREGWMSPLEAARRLAAGLSALSLMDLYVFGRQAGDWDHGVTGGLVAGLLDLPWVPLVRAVWAEEGSLYVEREVEGGSEAGRLGGRCAMSATNGPGTLLRVPKVRDVMAAGRKPIEVLAAAEVEGALSLRSVGEKSERRRGDKVAGTVDEVAGAFVDTLLALKVVGS